MSWFEAIVLGLVQGLTEFLPISSSAHLRITAALAGWHDPGAAFTAVTQIGTEAAVLLYFRRDIGRIISTWVRSLGRRDLRSHPDARMGWLIIVGTIPIGVLGVTLKETIEGPFRDLRLIATTLIVLGVILAVADRFASQRLKLDDLSVRDGLLFGLAQSMALIPGVSRSGATITGGLLLGYTREAAARYSFLLAIPAVLASGIFELSGIGGSHVSWGPTIVATLIAFAVGYAAVAWFLRYISTRSFTPFVVYRVALGVLILVLVGTGLLAPESGAFN